MSQLSNFYNKIFDYSLKKGTKIKFHEMMKFSNSNKINTIPVMTSHIYNEIPIRLANRVVDLNSLPFGLSKNHSINRIREWYLLSFEELTHIKKKPETETEIIDFKNIISKIYDRHSTTLSIISKGLYELQLENKISFDMEAPVIQSFLNRFHTNRTEIRILLEHYMSFFEESTRENYYGIINKQTNIGENIHHAIDNIQHICDVNNINLYLHDIIKINIPEPIILPSIEHYLYYIFFEILKNSVESVKNKKTPQISIDVRSIDEEMVLIKIQDNGGGISETNIDKIWYYSYTTHPIQNNDIIEQIDFSNVSPLSGFGYGLPISEIYINFLNSSSHNIKIYSNYNKTSVYIFLKNIKNR